MAKIKDARIAAAHEGVAELIVRVEYENGGISEVALDQTATAALMASCDATSLEDLEGHAWDKIRDALQVSFNRFQVPSAKPNGQDNSRIEES